jgi:hypothetical protein
MNRKWLILIGAPPGNAQGTGFVLVKIEGCFIFGVGRKDKIIGKALDLYTGRKVLWV